MVRGRVKVREALGGEGRVKVREALRRVTVQPDHSRDAKAKLQYSGYPPFWMLPCIKISHSGTTQYNKSITWPWHC